MFSCSYLALYLLSMSVSFLFFSFLTTYYIFCFPVFYNCYFFSFFVVVVVVESSWFKTRGLFVNVFTLFSFFLKKRKRFVDLAHTHTHAHMHTHTKPLVF